MEMRKTGLKAFICVCLVLAAVLSFSACGVKKPIDKYESAVEEVCDAEKISYETKSIDYRNRLEDELAENYGFDAEIDRMFIVKDGETEQVCVVKFYKESQAKKFVKNYEKEKKINFFAKVERVIDFIKGEYQGTLFEIFKFDYACERDGDIVVYGDRDAVKAVTKAK